MTKPLVAVLIAYGGWHRRSTLRHLEELIQQPPDSVLRMVVLAFIKPSYERVCFVLSRIAARVFILMVDLYMAYLLNHI
jgi:predicted neutral ceramidase superfamily lipid hydrolase